MLQTSHLCNQLLTRHNRCRRLGQTATASPSRQRWKQIPSCWDIRLSKRKESRRGVNRWASNRIPATKNRAILRRSIRSSCRRESRKVLLKPVHSPASRRPHRDGRTSSSSISRTPRVRAFTRRCIQHPHRFSRLPFQNSFKPELVKPADLPFKAQAPLPREKLKVPQAPFPLK